MEVLRHASRASPIRPQEYLTGRTKMPLARDLHSVRLQAVWRDEGMEAQLDSAGVA